MMMMLEAEALVIKSISQTLRTIMMNWVWMIKMWEKNTIMGSMIGLWKRMVMSLAMMMSFESTEAPVHVAKLLPR